MFIDASVLLAILLREEDANYRSTAPLYSHLRFQFSGLMREANSTSPEGAPAGGTGV